MIDYEAQIAQSVAAEVAAFNANRLRLQQERAAARKRMEATASVKLEERETPAILPEAITAMKVNEKEPATMQQKQIAIVNCEDEEATVAQHEAIASMDLENEEAASIRQESVARVKLEEIEDERQMVNDTVPQKTTSIQKNLSHNFSSKAKRELSKDEDGNHSNQHRDSRPVANRIRDVVENKAKAKPSTMSKTGSVSVKAEETPRNTLVPKFVLASASKRPRTEAEPDKKPAELKRTRKVYNAGGTWELVDRDAIEAANTRTSSERGSQDRLGKNEPIREVLSAKFDNPSPSADLIKLCRMAERCIDHPGDPSLITQFRELIQIASIAEFSSECVKDSNQDFRVLRRIATSDLLTVELRSDVRILWERLREGASDGTLLRGVCIQRSRFEDGRFTKWKIPDKNYKRTPSDVVGANGLVNGQWWPWRVCAIRDGAHGTQEAGIYGRDGVGAYSIVVSGGKHQKQYEDRDDGDTLEYCGTSSKDSNLSIHTKYLEQSYTNGQPIRVLRGMSTSDYAPDAGIRYDGLYTITDRVILDRDTAMMRYTLQRVAGQDPIRCKGVDKRPTTHEIIKRDDIDRKTNAL